MSQVTKRGRGRPRSFDEKSVLAAARDAFWSRGLSGVSLDQVSAASGVARPGLAAAFGDKRALYLRTIDDFVEEMEKAAAALLNGGGGLRSELAAFFKGALAFYLVGDEPRGCMALCTLPVEAAGDPVIRARLADTIAATDAVFTARFRLAREQGHFPAGFSEQAHGALAAALLHSVGIRARAGASKTSLEDMIKSALQVLCGENT